MTVTIHLLLFCVVIVTTVTCLASPPALKVFNFDPGFEETTYDKSFVTIPIDENKSFGNGITVCFRVKFGFWDTKCFFKSETNLHMEPKQ